VLAREADAERRDDVRAARLVCDHDIEVPLDDDELLGARSHLSRSVEAVEDALLLRRSPASRAS